MTDELLYFSFADIYASGYHLLLLCLVLCSRLVRATVESCNSVLTIDAQAYISSTSSVVIYLQEMCL